MAWDSWVAKPVAVPADVANATAHRASPQAIRVSQDVGKHGRGKGLDMTVSGVGSGMPPMADARCGLPGFDRHSGDFDLSYK
ncbi:hypothetical protein [Pseudomonas aeruginosa]|uniref:hypothetical protein n=1 Tax=Pseudomonas aeruginosa TaxID=287 RepID=UPI003D2BBB53